MVELIELERKVAYWGRRYHYFTNTHNLIGAGHARIVWERAMDELEQCARMMERV